MPALNSRITEGSDLVRDTTPTPQQRAQSVLMGLAHLRSVFVSLDVAGASEGAIADGLRYIDTAETILRPLAYPRLSEGGKK